MGRQANPDAEPTIRTALKYLISFQTGYKSTEMYKYSYNLSEQNEGTPQNMTQTPSGSQMHDRQ